MQSPSDAELTASGLRTTRRSQDRALDATGFTATATPTGGQANDNDCNPMKTIVGGGNINYVIGSSNTADPRKTGVGFTLLELMVTVAVIAIPATIAVPLVGTPIEKQRLVAAAETLSGDLRWTRPESIKRNKRITVTYTRSFRTRVGLEKEQGWTGSR